jgi:hypothetical protein
VLLNDEDNDTNLLENDAEDATSDEEIADNKDNVALLVAVNEELLFVICVDSEVESGAIDALKEIKLELIGINEELLIPTTATNELTVEVNDAEFVVSDVENELEYVCAFVANDAVPNKELVIAPATRREPEMDTLPLN